ncbi:hypothetical protein TNCV_1392561 [Trichonephila clavipes]|nr:hypothetical protein TNCV_1392561 [Trichonephila clavipes]
MWFQLALYPDAPLLGVLVGSDNLLYFRIIDLGHLLGRKYGFAKQFPYDIVFGKDVLPRTQTYPRYTANARLVTQDTAYRILCRENRELAETLSNALDSGYAYVQGKRTFELTYKNSPRLLVVNTPMKIRSKCPTGYETLCWTWNDSGPLNCLGFAPQKRQYTTKRWRPLENGTRVGRLFEK